MAKVTCPGCGAEIDTESGIAKFEGEPPPAPELDDDDDDDDETRPAEPARRNRFRR